MVSRYENLWKTWCVCVNYIKNNKIDYVNNLCNYIASQVYFKMEIIIFSQWLWVPAREPRSPCCLKCWTGAWHIWRCGTHLWIVLSPVMSCNPHMPSLMHFWAELHAQHLFPMLSKVFPTNSKVHWSPLKLWTPLNKLSLSFSTFSLNPVLLSLLFLLFLLSLVLWSKNHVPQPPIFHLTHVSMSLLVPSKVQKPQSHVHSL